jgi:hypothetical protein
MSNRTFKLAMTASALLAVLSHQARAQQPDMDAMAKWGAADLVRYHIVGVYQGTSHVASDASGQGDFSDRVIIDLTWKLSEARLVGTPVIQNSKSAVTKLRDREPACLAPVLEGDLEFFDLVAVEDGPGGSLHFTARTTFPVVKVAQSCTASRKTVPAKVVEDTEQFGVPSPVLLAMGLPPSKDLQITPDKKSLIVPKNGWTWTFTPSIAK